ncbi:hypothetical protein C8R44DRAFT_865070 [Mycena epipterygia]|nr:hypothetical protein C8R44DRAFT_865070 [Mycena epipterygia]
MPTSSPTGDDNADAGRPPPGPTSAAPLRHIIDLELDDGNKDWVDSIGLGTSTHRSRNPGQVRIPVRKRKRDAGGKNDRSSMLKKRRENASKMQRFSQDLNALEKEHDEHAQRLSDKHSIKVKEKGNRLMIPDVKVLVAEDPSLLEGFMEEEVEGLLANLVVKCDRRQHGTRTKNRAANADAKRTIGHVVQEVNGMAQRANIIGFVMFSRGHLHDMTTPTTISTGGALDFFRDVLKKEPADIISLFELWAVNRETGKSSNTLRGMQTECKDMILMGLISKKTRVAMNYENYMASMVEGKNIGLVGWPQGVELKRMSLQSALPPLKILRDALKAGTCRWKVLTPTERQRILNNFEDMVEKGQAKAKAKGRRRGRGASRVKRSSSDEDESGGEQVSGWSGGTVREKLLALFQEKKAAAAVAKQTEKRKTTGARSNGAAKRTGKAPSTGATEARKTNTSNDARPTKDTADARARDAEPPTKHKKKHADDEPPVKRKKKHAEDEPPAKGKRKHTDNKPPAKCKHKHANGEPPRKAQEGRQWRVRRACSCKAEATTKANC